jgi:hypothetical protein
VVVTVIVPVLVIGARAAARRAAARDAEADDLDTEPPTFPIPPTDLVVAVRPRPRVNTAAPGDRPLHGRDEP